VQKERHTGFMRIMEQMIDPFRVERGGAPLGAVDRVALGEQEFGKIGAVLPGDAGDQCNTRHDGSLLTGSPHERSDMRGWGSRISRCALIRATKLSRVYKHLPAG